MNLEAEIDRLMLAAIFDVEAATTANRMNYFVAKLLGSIANLLGHQEILKRTKSLLAHQLTAADLFRGAFTNIDWRTLTPESSIDCEALNRQTHLVLLIQLLTAALQFLTCKSIRNTQIICSYASKETPLLP